MTVSVCPTAMVAAPDETVWSVLNDPSSYDEWWDARTERIEPPGPATPGQTVYATAHGLGRSWPVTTRVLAVDPTRHAIDLVTTLPFGIVGRNHIDCVAIDAASCRVTFG